MMKSANNGHLTIDEQQHDDKQRSSVMRSNNIANNKKGQQACAYFVAACVGIALYNLGSLVGDFVWDRLSCDVGVITFARGGGRDFSVDVNHGTISPKDHPEFVLGADPVPSLVLVKKGSTDQLVFGDVIERQQPKTGDDTDTTTTSSSRSMALATFTHKVVFKSLTTTEGVNGPWRYKDICVVEHSNQPAAAAVRVTLVEDNFLQIEGEDLVLDVAYWNMEEGIEEGTAVNFVGGTSSEDKTLMKDGGRDWVLNEDGTIATKSNPDLVLGIAKPRMILVGKGSKDQLVFDQLLINGERQIHVDDKTGVVYIPLTLQSHQGMAVGKKFSNTKRAGEWDYIESAIVPREEALIVQYVDCNFIKLYDEDLLFDVSYWQMYAGNTVNFVGAASDFRPQDQGKADNLRKTPPPPPPPPPSTSASEQDNDTESSETPAADHPLEDSPRAEESPSTPLETPEETHDTKEEDDDNNGSSASDEDIMVLEGFSNRMPTLGTTIGGRDYVTLGSHESWKSDDAPVFLKIDGFKGGRSVSKETFDYMSRGWTLSDGMFDGTVQLSNGDQVPVKINVTKLV